MPLQLKLALRAVALVCLTLIFNNSSFAQKRTLTIKGNIKLLQLTPQDIDECCFYYEDVLSSKPIVIPIRRDNAGNYEVSFDIDYYQQIYFGKGRNIPGLSVYDTGMSYFTFFGKPGQTMRLDYVQKPRDLNYKGDFVKFAGDFSAENQQYQAYDKAKDRAVKNIYDGLSNKGLSPAEIKAHALNSFKDQLKFNNEYFKTHPTAKFIKEQAFYEALYQTQSVAINMTAIGGYKVTEAMADDFYKAMKITGNTFADRPGMSVANTDGNPSLKNPAALGGNRYKHFLNSYYFTLQQNLFYPKYMGAETKDIATYIMETHPDVKDDYRKILDKVLAGNKLDAADAKTMDKIEALYIREILDIKRNKIALDQFLAIKDPALRDMNATMYLYRKLEINKLAEIKPLIDAYKNGVKNEYLKNKFLTAYNGQLDRLTNSKLSSLSVIKSSEELTGTDLLTNLLAKYKGKVVYLDIWATWCVPCIANMPSAAKLREKLRGKDVVFIYACLNSPSQTNWKNLIADQKIEGENYFFDPGQSASIGKSLNIKAFPTYALIDKNGNIINNNATKPGESKTLEDINALLN
jgi:thiol-disulfide isomerase/thioredoxin